MHHVMFDVDGTLVESFEFDEACYLDAVYAVLGHYLDSDWNRYAHVSDAGILDEHLQSIGKWGERDAIHAEVKKAFIANIEAHLKQTPAKPIRGAAGFIKQLRANNSVSISIATGGWGETALLKLKSAGIDVRGLPLISSNDHYSRTEIMKIARQKAGATSEHNITYFGDAAWDKRACETLGFNFVLVGERCEHHQSIDDFTATAHAMSFIGL